MNKAELVAAMAERTELSKKDAEAALKAFTDVVAELDSEPLRYLREQPEQEEIRRLVRRCQSRLPSLRSLRQERL